MECGGSPPLSRRRTPCHPANNGSIDCFGWKQKMPATEAFIASVISEIASVGSDECLSRKALALELSRLWLEIGHDGPAADADEWHW
jgi:hypothetical protein